ncbi:hypothetical protein CCACVL1_27323 [Corchorus capsularis]|uniref:Uncharacterized protein n=1 Tax=Corchorus capsularis TaxID=210143 RepID=A0A1R3GB05_COCAP|nr:hypothetical protein CCACVL1_27323 [Corchorus capsularis]
MGAIHIFNSAMTHNSTQQSHKSAPNLEATIATNPGPK